MKACLWPLRMKDLLADLDGGGLLDVELAWEEDETAKKRDGFSGGVGVFTSFGWRILKLLESRAPFDTPRRVGGVRTGAEICTPRVMVEGGGF